MTSATGRLRHEEDFVKLFWVGGGAKWLNNHELSMEVSVVKSRTALNGLLFSLPLHQVWIESVCVLLNPGMTTSCATATAQQHSQKKSDH